MSNTDMDAVAMDLNTDISKQYNWTEKFDLVTNNGTGEHVFNCTYSIQKHTRFNKGRWIYDSFLIGLTLF